MEVEREMISVKNKLNVSLRHTRANAAGEDWDWTRAAGACTHEIERWRLRQWFLFKLDTYLPRRRISEGWTGVCSENIFAKGFAAVVKNCCRHEAHTQAKLICEKMWMWKWNPAKWMLTCLHLFLRLWEISRILSKFIELFESWLSLGFICLCFRCFRNLSQSI